MSNHLKNALSPYLLAHKDNPVDWYPWGEEALTLAQEKNIPIFLSIGYAACHWCHVMAHESFEDPLTAQFLNQHFVPIKIDREERPDLDAIYMDALLRLQGQGGWPMTLFLFPDGKPFFGGTYFPNTPRYGQISFIQLLQNIHYYWEHERQELKNFSDKLSQILGTSLTPEAHPVHLTQHHDTALKMIDPKEGGLLGAPKFPQIPLWTWFLSLAQQVSDLILKKTAETLAVKLCQGGIYDHVGGGWMRYSTDEIWLVPHFEKMLYDNALIMNWLCYFAYTANKHLFRQRILETIAWLNREMQLANGLYAASLDADTEHEEGKYYVWDKKEIETILGRENTLFNHAYQITDQGNWEGKTILHQNHTAFNTESGDFPNELKKLFDARQTRVSPARDEKVLTDWNAFLITALTKVSFIYDYPEALSLANTTFQKLEQALYRQGQWRHCKREDQITEEGFLEDYAAVIEAALELYCHTHYTDYLYKAKHWTNYLEENFFSSKNNGFYQCHQNQNKLFTNLIQWDDHATPCGNGLMAINYAKLWLLTNENHYQQQLEKIVTHHENSNKQTLSSLHLAKLWLTEHRIIHLDLNQITKDEKNILLPLINPLTLVIHSPGQKKIQFCHQQKCYEIPFD